MGRFLRSKHLRNALWLAAGGKCQMCGRDLPEGWHADHVVPYSESGITDVREMQALCPECNLKKGATVDAQLLMLQKARVLIESITKHDAMIRRHQREILQIVERIVAGTHDWKDANTIIAEVVPGGGKSYLAVIMASVLIGIGYVERCLWLVPRSLLGHQAEDDFNKKDFSQEDGTPFNPFNPAEVTARALPDLVYPLLRQDKGKRNSVAIASYQMVACTTENTSKFKEFVRERPTLLVADEAQMMYGDWSGDSGDSWGDAFDQVAGACLNAGGKLFIMSGFLHRHDGQLITRVPYALGDTSKGQTPERQYPVTDINYTLADAQAERASIRLDFDVYRGSVRFSMNGVPVNGELETRDERYEGRKLETYLNERSVWQAILDDMVASWRNYNRVLNGYDSRILVISYNQNHARQHQAYLEKKHGIRTVLAIDDQPKVHEAIREFRLRQTDHRAMVTVGMAYIGLSVPDFSHMAYLGKNRSLPYCIQAFHRITRFDRKAPVGYEYQIARFFVPADPKMIEIKKQILEMQHPGIRETSPPKTPPPGPPDRKEYVPIAAEITGRQFETQNRPIIEHDAVDTMIRRCPKLHFLERADVEVICHAARGEDAAAKQPWQQEASAGGSHEEAVLRDQIEITTRQIDRIMAAKHGQERYPFGWFNSVIVRRFCKSRKEMGPDELRQVQKYADDYLRRLEADCGTGE